MQKLCSKTKNFLNLLLSNGEVITDFYGTDITKESVTRDADVIVLHWVNSFISYKVVDKLKRLDKPIIWIMHDMWVFTGGCHYDWYCGKYTQTCKNCPLAKNRWGQFLAEKNLQRKKEIYGDGSIVFVGPGKEVVENARKSIATSVSDVKYIPNPVDIEIYRPLDRKKAKHRFCLEDGKTAILFGAVKAKHDVHKGYSDLKRMLNESDTKRMCLVVFGNCDRDRELEKMIEVHYLGYISDEKQMAELYNASDLYITPSEEETFGQTVAEALACDTPVLAYRIGGISDMVRHRENGYLATLHDIEDLKSGLEFCCQKQEQLRIGAGSEIRREFNFGIVGKSYKQLCEELLKERAENNKNMKRNTK